MNGLGFFVFVVVAVVIGYFYTRNKAKVPPASMPAAVVVPPTPFTGAWIFDIVPPDGAKWGDGVHPDESAGTASARGDWAPGLCYRLGGSGEFSRTDTGLLVGTANIYGHECAIAVPVPTNGAAVGFESDGAYFEFHFDSATLTGKVCEPHDCGNKYGTVVGQKVSA